VRYEVDPPPVACCNGGMRPVVFATAAEIRTLAERANALLQRALGPEDDDLLDEEDEREADERSLRQSRRALSTLRFCCSAAGFLGDPTLVSVVIEGLASFESWDRHACDDRTEMAAAMAQLLRAGAKVDDDVRGLAAHRDERLRLAVAAGLLPRGDEETALLEALAADPAPAVRDAAKKALAEVREMPWWKGKLGQDPALGLAPDEASRLAPVFLQVSALLDRSQYELFHKPEHLEPLRSAVAALPDGLAVDLVERLCGSLELYYLERAAPLLADLFGRSGGAAALDRLVTAWAGDPRSTVVVPELVAGAISAGSSEARREVCLRFLRGAAEAALSLRRDASGAPALRARVAARAWPPDQDVTPFLDALLRLAAEEDDPAEMDYVGAFLGEIFGRPDVQVDAVIPRIAEAQLQGLPGAWARIARPMQGVLLRASPGFLRELAERGLASSDEGTVQWAVTQLLGAAFDEARDGPPIERVRALMAEPRLRAAIVAAAPAAARAIVVRREALRRGELPYPEAVNLLQQIGSLYGGVALRGGVLAAPAGSMTAQMHEKMFRDGLAGLEAWLGPEEMRGPPSEREWARLREARAAFTPESETDAAWLWLKSLPSGPWSAEDRAELERLFEAHREGTPRLAFLLATALACKADAELLSRFDEVLAGAGPESRRLYRRMREETREHLGLPPSPVAPAADSRAPADEWPDEPAGETEG
jgi:hypothetical protein